MTSPAVQALRKTLEAKLAAHREAEPAAAQPANWSTGRPATDATASVGAGGHRLPAAPAAPAQQTPAWTQGQRGRPAGGAAALGGHRNAVPGVDDTAMPPLPDTPMPPLPDTPMPPLPGVPDAQMPPLPARPGTKPGTAQGLAPEREGHAGRRGDILEQFNTRTGMYENAGDDAVAPTIFKLTIAGSGCEVWKTSKGDEQKRARLFKIDGVGEWEAKKTAAFTNDKDDLMFSGPMGKGGVSDSGGNSIKNLIKAVPEAVMASLPAGTDGENIILVVKSHSRGAVAAGFISKALKARMPKMKVELTQFDPVEGAAQQFNDYDKIDLGETSKGDAITPALDETTIVYSMASGYPALARSFMPQKVVGVKRIIISRQNHGGGILTGYMIGNEKYRGARLNSMPPGAYYETGVASGGGNDGYITLQRMTEDNFLKMLDDTFATKVAHRDIGRFDVVKSALKEFFKRVDG